MKRPSTVSRPVLVLLVSSALFAGAGWMAPRLRPLPSGLDPELPRLRVEQAQVRGLDDTSLRELRQRVAAHPLPAWTAAQLNTLGSALAGEWETEWEAEEGGTRRLTLIRRDPRLSDWSAYLEALHSWTTRPGVVLDSLEIVAGGAATARRFQRVALTLRFAMAEAAISNAGRAPGGPPPVAPAVEAGPTRNIGPVPSRLRSSAAPFRPDLPGVPGRNAPPGTQKSNEEKP